MSLPEALRSADWQGAVTAFGMRALLSTTVSDLRQTATTAGRSDQLEALVRMLIRSLRQRGGQFVSPAAIIAGGVVREIAGCVTLPEQWRQDAVHAPDGSLRATATLDSYVGDVTLSGQSETLFDPDTATGWTISLTSPVAPVLSYPETGEQTAAFFAIRVALDSPQMISQIELGIGGDPVRLFRIEDGDTGTILWSGSSWIDPGTLLMFAQRSRVQSLRLLFLQPHGFYDGQHYTYQTTLTTLSLLDVAYPTDAYISLPDLPLSQTLIRPVVEGSGNTVLQLFIDGTWRDATQPLTLQTVQKQEEVLVSGTNLLFLTEVPEALNWLSLRSSTGQATQVDLLQVEQTGNILRLPTTALRSVAVISYQYRPAQLPARLHLLQTGAEWTSPLVREVYLA